MLDPPANHRASVLKVVSMVVRASHLVLSMGAGAASILSGLKPYSFRVALAKELKP